MLVDQIMAYEDALSSLDPATLGWEAYSLAVLIVAQFTYFTSQNYLVAGANTLNRLLI